ncbi:MAG TPA: ABC transporter ATP-binding protein [Saprospiraceae bacterium]|nr:ABC transporter ATP-binding protein [Saprospiraceae bacterium]HNT21632.1 ABC transporter ATP-binding protein [Saprospiraceae bacterium]
MWRNPYLNLLATAWKYARNEKRRYLNIYGFYVITNLLNALRPILYGWFIHGLETQGVAVLRQAWLYVAAYLGLNLLFWLFHGPARVMERKLAFNLGRNFKMELFHQALHLPVKWHQDHHSGTIINRIQKAYQALKDFFQDGFMFFEAFAKFILSFAAMLYFSPFFGGLALVMGMLTIWIIFKFDKPLIQNMHERNEKEHLVSSNLFDTLSNINTVITLRLEDQMKKSLSDRIAQVWPPYRKNVTLNEWKWFVADMLVALIYAIIILGYVSQQYQPGETFILGGLVTLVVYVHQFTSVFHDIAWQYNQIIRYNTDVLSVGKIQEAWRDLHPRESVEDFPEEWKQIEISGLQFSHHGLYSDKNKTHSLHDIRLRLEKGKRIALIGESGSGKSTLLALLRGLYPAEPGLLLNQDGHLYHDLAPVNRRVTLFPQEPEIFENTIRYNITLGLPVEDAEINQVCETASFKEVLDQLPKGLESSIKEKGVNLSGGQKQRLALARGILAARTSDIILMDEPSSSVDPRTELVIYRRLFHLFKDKVLVSALHRLHLLVHFDYIYVMQDGRILEEGTFDHLRKNGRIFGELWKHQETSSAGGD